MADAFWLGDAPAVQQISSATVDSMDAATTYTITIGGLAVSVVGSVDVNTTAANLHALATAVLDKRFAEMTWTNPGAPSDTITATMKSGDAGKPFTAALTVSGGTGTVTDFSDDTANSGPNDWNTASNWGGTNAVPVNTNDVYLQNSAVPIFWGLDQNGVDLASLTVRPSYNGTGVGLPRTNTNGYVEYRPRYLKIGSTTTLIDGSGIGRFNLDANTTQTAITVNGSSTPAEATVPPILILGVQAANTLLVNKGSVGLAWHPGEVSTFLTLTTEFITAIATDAILTIGDGVTLTTINQNGGVVTCQSAATTITVSTGSLTFGGTGALTTLDLRGGICFYKSTGTLTTGNISGILDFQQDGRARIVTNMNLFKGGSILDPSATVGVAGWTNGIDLVRTSQSEVTLSLGDHLSWAVAVI